MLVKNTTTLRSRKKNLLGVMPDKPQQCGPASLSFDGAECLIVEFDDQGLCYDRRQMHMVTAWLNAIRDDPEVNDAIIIAFAHGWKHNGASDDDNLANFCGVLKAVAARERASEALARPVIGLFIAWRGLSLYGLKLENLTFWDRKQAGARVATGAVRELLGRVRQFRNERAEQGRTVLVIVGHSFGGMIVYSAIAQSLIEAAATDGAETPSFANLVVLVNPAFEAVRYLPVHTLLRERHARNPPLPPQPRPVFVSVTASNDEATGVAFPLGMAFSRVQESANTPKEKEALIHTMGHISWLRTHELTPADSAPIDPSKQRSFGKALLTRTQFGPENPFWTVRAQPEIVNHHSEIFKPAFLEFLQELVFDHM